MTAPATLAGKTAPDFSLETDSGDSVTLSKLRGKPAVLFFYPKDDTSGCTIEVCSFRDHLPRLEGLDAVVLGISPDSAKSHRKFKEKFQLTYPLLVDAEHKVAEKYGVWGEKMLYGRKYMGVMRTTFIIGRDGRVAKVFEKVKPEEHAVEVAEAVASIR